MSGGGAAAVRRLSSVDHGQQAPSTAGGISALHGGSRAAMITTSTSAHARRVSVSGVGAGPSAAVNRHYENSYKTEPERTFSSAAAKRVVREVMDTMLEGKKYDKESCKQLTVSVADAIKKKVKELGYSRYKIVTNVAIGQADDSSVAFASRCVWNVSFDSFVEYTYKNASLFAVGLVYALYSE